MSTTAPPRSRDVPAEPREVPRRDPSWVPGEPGLWVFILLDLVVFTAFFATIAVLRGRDVAVFAAGQEELSTTLAVVNTVLLLTGSLVVAGGVHAARMRDAVRARRLLAAGAATGLAFAAVKAVEYSALMADDHTMRSGDFFLAYFAFTGIHLMHVLLGVAILLAVRAHLVRPADEVRVGVVEGGAAYWHMVDLVWLILFPLLYLSA